MPQFANTQDLVTIEEIRDNAIVLKTGRLLRVLMVDGFGFSLKSEDEQNVIAAGYQNFLNSIDYPVQIIIHSRKINIENYLKALGEFKGAESSALLQSQISEYQEFVKSFVKDNPIMTKTFFVVVPYSPVGAPGRSSFLKIFPFIKNKAAVEAQARRESEEDFQRNLAQLEQRTNQVSQGLRAIGLEVIRLDNQGLLELFYNFYNPETVEREDVVPQAGGKP